MTPTSRLTMRWPVALVIGALLVATGVGAAYFGLRAEDRAKATTDPLANARLSPDAARGVSTAADQATGNAPLPDVAITLSAETLERAGVVVATVESQAGVAMTRLPAVIEPNAYRQVAVTPLAAGRITRVAAELGAPVKPGQVLAEIFSPELADAQSD